MWLVPKKIEFIALAGIITDISVECIGSVEAPQMSDHAA